MRILHENYKLKLQLSTLICYQPSVASSSKNLELYLVLLLVKLQRQASTHSLSSTIAGGRVGATEANREIIFSRTHATVNIRFYKYDAFIQGQQVENSEYRRIAQTTGWSGKAFLKNMFK